MSSLFPPCDIRQAPTSLSSCWLCPPCRHLILFLRYPLTDHKLQPTAAVAVSAAVPATDYVLRPHYNQCQEDNIVVAVILACGVLVVVVNRSPALMIMGPRPSFSWRDGNWHAMALTSADTCMGGLHHLLPPRRQLLEKGRMVHLRVHLEQVHLRQVGNKYSFLIWVGNGFPFPVGNEYLFPIQVGNGFPFSVGNEFPFPIWVGNGFLFPGGNEFPFP